jgi:hypothetical protein
MTMLADAKTLLGGDVATGTTHDTLLSDIIEGILAEADEYMEAGYRKAAGAIAYFDGGKGTIYLPHVNVTVSSIEVDGSAIAATEYTVYPESGRVRYGGSGLSGFVFATEASGGRFPSGMRSVKVTYDGGYEEDDYPASLRRKLLKQVSYEFRRRNDPGLSAVSFPNGSVQKYAINEWLPDVEAELKRRRRIFL